MKKEYILNIKTLCFVALAEQKSIPSPYSLNTDWKSVHRATRFYWQAKLVDSAGRVERFLRKYGDQAIATGKKPSKIGKKKEAGIKTSPNTKNRTVKNRRKSFHSLEANIFCRLVN